MKIKRPAINRNSRKNGSFILRPEIFYSNEAYLYAVNILLPLLECNADNNAMPPSYEGGLHLHDIACACELLPTLKNILEQEIKTGKVPPRVVVDKKIKSKNDLRDLKQGDLFNELF